MSILVKTNCPESSVKVKGIQNWPIWTCYAIYFDWSNENKETCFLLEGEMTVTPEKGHSVKFSAGDLVKL